MDKEQIAASTVNGYLFGSADDVELANQELNAVRYIEKKIENKNGNTVLAIYRAALDKKMFRTPVGYSYMHELQKRMLSMGVRPEELSPVPLYQVFNNKLEDEKVPRVIRVKKKTEPLKRKNAMLTLVNVILVILIIIMFAISMSGNRPTVLNYRRTLENEYSSWKQELDEREAVIREKERELDIKYGNGEDTGSR
ncbi:MAG: hypothetical protein K6G69_06725 [Lachnospiraceae bacterium]|nr:hypothetical protein [Lachnospiraceae bacterium]